MKVGIITLNGYYNFGNRLQNLALQEVLESLNLEVETIRFEVNSKSFFKRAGRSILNKITLNNDKEIDKIRKKKFIDFSKKYIKETDKIYSIWESNSELRSRFDKIVIGSDQVWNPSYNRLSGVFYGDFMNPVDIISYAASFGVSELSEEEIEFNKHYLSRIPNISVREKSASFLINKLIGKRPIVVVDPTLLIDEHRWREIAIKKENDKFILTYFLGEFPDNINKMLEDYEKKGFKVINILDKTDESSYVSDPGEFLGYIDNSSLFLTDSFHGVVFSILFDTPFLVFKRDGSEEMYSRIETLLSLFDLENREAESFNDWPNIMEIHIENKEKILARERKKSLDFLIESLDM